MGLNPLTERIFYLAHEPDVDRPMLAYIQGERYALAIDAGYSAAHVQKFYRAIEDAGLRRPDFTVITHWHYDHTFGMHAISGLSIAHEKTRDFLKDQQKKAENPGYLAQCRAADIHFAREYGEEDRLHIVLPDITFSHEISLDLGGLAVRAVHTVSPHSQDTVCVYVPQERVLFLGDSTSEDFFNGGYMDKDRLRSLMAWIESVDCDLCILSHCPPLTKEALLAYLQSIL